MGGGKTGKKSIPDSLEFLEDWPETEGNLLGRREKICLAGEEHKMDFFGNFGRFFFQKNQVFIVGMRRELGGNGGCENSREEFQGLGIGDWIFLPGGEIGIGEFWRKWFKKCHFSCQEELPK